MAKLNGTSFLLYADGNPVGSTTSSTLTISVEEIPTTNKSSGGWEEQIAGGGLRSGEITFEGFEDPTDTVNVNELFDFINTRADFAFQLTTNSAGDDIWTGTCTLMNLEINYEMEQAVSISGTAKINGTPTRTTET